MHSTDVETVKVAVRAMEQKRDYYEILGVTREAPFQGIKEAYRRLAFEYHPDRNPGNGSAVERMKEINEAYAVLSDADKRSRYDRMRREYGSSAHDRFRRDYSQDDIFRGSDINQVFEEMARAFGFRGFEEIFSQAYGQGYRTFEFRRPGVFGKVIILGSGWSRRANPELAQPAGLPGVFAKLAGYVLRKMLELAAGPREKDQYDLLYLDAKLAEGGGRVTYRGGADSKEFTVTVPPGMRDGQIMRLRGAGSNTPGEPAGDLYLKVQIRKSLLRKVRAFLKS
jgi:DnaJ-class molecular chaperone